MNKKQPSKLGQKRLEESEKKFRSIVEQSGDGIVLLDKNGTITDYNSTMEEMSGIPRSEAIGKKIWDVQYRLFPPAKRTKEFMRSFRKQFTDAFRTGTAGWLDKILEVAAVREDGSTLLMQTLVSRIRVGRRTIYVSFNRDVTRLRQAEHELEEQNRLLLEKNIALREVMAQLEIEKKSMAEKVRTNIDRLVLPLLERIKRKGAEGIEKHVQLLEENLRDITAGFGSVLSQGLTKLTRQEIEICDMVRQGLRCREIAEILNISVRTVETHRSHIRRKLSIAGSNNNLVTYLKNIT